MGSRKTFDMDEEPSPEEYDSADEFRVAQAAQPIPCFTRLGHRLTAMLGLPPPSEPAKPTRAAVGYEGDDHLFI